MVEVKETWRHCMCLSSKTRVAKCADKHCLHAIKANPNTITKKQCSSNFPQKNENKAPLAANTNIHSLAIISSCMCFVVACLGRRFASHFIFIDYPLSCITSFCQLHLTRLFIFGGLCGLAVGFRLHQFGGNDGGQCRSVCLHWFFKRFLHAFVCVCVFCKFVPKAVFELPFCRFSASNKLIVCGFRPQFIHQLLCNSLRLFHVSTCFFW